MKKDKTDFPDKTNFESLKDFTLTEFRNYWIILLIRTLDVEILKSSKYNEIISNIKTSSVIDLKNLAKEENIAEKLMQILYEVNNQLQKNNQFL